VVVQAALPEVEQPAALTRLNPECCCCLAAFREGAECRCLGATTRSKQILVIKAQVNNQHPWGHISRHR